MGTIALSFTAIKLQINKVESIRSFGVFAADKIPHVFEWDDVFIIHLANSTLILRPLTAP